MKSRFNIVSVLFFLFISLIFFGCSTASAVRKVAVPSPVVELAETAASVDNRGPVYSLEWSPSGECSASAGYAEARIRDGLTAETVFLLEGHSDFIWGLAWSPDGKQLATVCQDGLLIIWNAETGEAAEQIFLDGDWAYCVDWSYDGKLLAAGCEGSRVLVFNTDDWSMRTALECSSSVIAVGWSHGDNRLAAAQWDGAVRLWNMDNTAEPVILDIPPGSRHDANGLAWSPDSTIIAAAYQDRSVRLWNTATGELEQRFTGFGGWVRAVAWSPDGKMIAAGGQKFTIKIWSVDDGMLLKSKRLPRLPIWSMSWSADRGLALGSGAYTERDTEGFVRLFELSIN